MPVNGTIALKTHREAMAAGASAAATVSPGSRRLRRPIAKPDLPGDCSGESREPLVALEDALGMALYLAVAVTQHECIGVHELRGRISSGEIQSTIDLPPFNQSAVDGYGFRFLRRDADLPKPARLIRRIAPGSSGRDAVRPGEAVRLFTGSCVPTGVTAVVKEEECQRDGDWVVPFAPPRPGANIRLRGEDLPAGGSLVRTGVLLDGRHAALLAAAGLDAVSVIRRLRVLVLSIGSELTPPGAELSAGSIYDSNRPMLLNLLGQPWIEPVDGGCGPDEPESLARLLQTSSDAFVDLIVTTGAAFGSETDHLAAAIRRIGGEALTLQLAVRPGKPIVFGKIGNTPVLGLPGNPVAAMLSYLLFAYPVARACAGSPVVRPRGIRAVAASAIPHRPGRTEFTPVRIAPTRDDLLAVEQIGSGGSARLAPLSVADGLAEIPADSPDLAPGSPLIFHPFRSDFCM